MKPTSLLIAGGVLLFGAMALVNVLLPAPGARVSETLASAPLSNDPAAPHTSIVDPSPIQNTLPAATAAPVSTLPATDAPLPRVSPEITKAAGARIVKSPEPAPPKKESQTLLASWLDRAKEHLSPASKAPEPEASAPVVNSPPPAPSTGGPGAAPAPPDKVTVSVTNADHAWIRIGDKKTMMAKVGDLVPGVGTITAISKSSVTIDGSRILEVGK